MSTSRSDAGPVPPVSGHSFLSLEVSLSRPSVLPRVEEDEPLHVLLRISGQLPIDNCQLAIANCSVPPHSAPLPPRPPVHLTLLLDASGSMHRIVLEGAERDYWRRLAAERGDLKRGRVDGREGWLWSGRTLAELQARERTPMQAALHALARAGERLRPADGLVVVAFADRAHRLVAAHAADRARQIQETAALLSRGVEESGLGDGTRLAEALRLALEPSGNGSRDRSNRIDGIVSKRMEAHDGGLEEQTEDPVEPVNEPSQRILLISDGLVEDRLAGAAWVERIADAGIPLSCIGVGDQFDEELLMEAADTTRGRFCYAPSADALEAAVAEELDRLETLAVRRLTLTLRPAGGVLFRDLCQVTPDLSALHRAETDGSVFRFSLGDLSHRREALFLAELSLPPLPPGDHSVLAIELTGEDPGGRPLPVPAAEAVVRATPDLIGMTVDPMDLEAVAAVHAYRAERQAQRALRRGRIGEATRHLRDTRQIVERLGHAGLAAELEAQAAAFEAGTCPSAEQVKRVKAETRRLMG